MTTRVFSITGCVVLAFTILGCQHTADQITKEQQVLFDKASKNGALASEGFNRCNNYMNAWLSFADP